MLTRPISAAFTLMCNRKKPYLTTLAETHKNVHGVTVSEMLSFRLLWFFVTQMWTQNSQNFPSQHKCIYLLCVKNADDVSVFPTQDRHSERQKDSRLNLRPPSHSATYATVSAWHHQPEKLILDSCGYEATVSYFYPVFYFFKQRSDKFFVLGHENRQHTIQCFCLTLCSSCLSD